MVKSQLVTKHEQMAQDPFVFLRATFYRWSQVWPEVCADAAKAPKMLAVGDLHVATFGTWRDQLGRLIWGIDDFDESYPLPYTNDLVRLATGAAIAIGENHLAIGWKEACDTILQGHKEGLKQGGHAFVLEEKHK